MTNKEIPGKSPEKNFPQGSTQEKLDTLKASLEKTTDVIERKKIREEILSINRSVNRTKQYTRIAGEKLADGKNSLDDISAADLMRLDKELKSKSGQERRGEFLSKSFLYKRTLDEKGDIFEESSDGKNLKEGDSLYVDFGKNPSAENAIGAGDMLSMDIKVVKITDNQGNIRVGKRSIQGNKVGYYDQSGYIHVYSGFKIDIPTAQETENYLKESKDIPLSNSIEEEEKALDEFIGIAERAGLNGGSSPWEIESKQEFQKQATALAKEIELQYGIPWQVTYAQSVIESGWGKSNYARNQNNYFGMRDGTVGFKTFANMSESFHAYGKKIGTEARYRGALAYKNDPIKFLETVLDSGYIDPRVDDKSRYMSNAISLINNYDSLAKASLAEGPANEAIIDMALNAQKRGDTLRAAHCTDWVDKIYQATLSRSVYSSRTFYNGITAISGGTGIGGRHAEGNEISKIKPGNHIVVDKPPYNSGKTHSIIALSSPVDGIMKVVSYPNFGIPPKIEIYDLYGNGRGDKDGKPLRIQGA